jgi:GntR family transcriptional regulator, transcriptional repressor for pyruvate dehydrogenase complex
VTEPSFNRVTRTRAYQAVVAQIEDAIIRGELRPGARLPSEREMAGTFGVSRVTIREAVRALESAGLVKSKPNDPHGGAIIQLPSAENFERSLLSFVRFERVTLTDVIEFRLLIESAACHLAAHNRDPVQLDDIVHAHEELEAMVDVPTADFVAADIAFHLAVARASGSRLLELCTQAARSAIQLLISETLRDSRASDVKADFVRRHGALVEAIKAGDGMEAARRSRQDIIDYYVPMLPEQEAVHVSSLLALLAPKP